LDYSIQILLIQVNVSVKLSTELMKVGSSRFLREEEGREEER